MEVQGRLHVELLDAGLEAELPELLEHVVHEVRRGEAVDRRLVIELLGERRIHLVLGDEVLAHHRLQDLGLPELRRFGVQHRVPLGRRLRKSREHGGLRQVELRGGDVEVALGRGLDAV